MRNEFEKAMLTRHACKLFNGAKEISAKDIEWILEMGRLSPSSFGLEPWHFLVIKDPKVKAALRPACWDQPQVTDCSHFVVLLVKKPHFFQAGSEYLDRAFKRRTKDNTQMLEAIKSVFDNFQKNELKPGLEDWAKMQAYIASANMMTGAASIGIDSCPIEGFVYDNLEKSLATAVPSFNPKEYGIAYCIAFGYRVNEEVSVKLRWSAAEVATFV